MDPILMTIDCPSTLRRVCADIKAREADERLGVENEHDRLADLLSRVNDKEVQKLAEVGMQMKIAKRHNAVRARAIRDLGVAMYNGEVYRTGVY